MKLLNLILIALLLVLSVLVGTSCKYQHKMLLSEIRGVDTDSLLVKSGRDTIHIVPQDYYYTHYKNGDTIK